MTLLRFTTCLALAGCCMPMAQTQAEFISADSVVATSRFRNGPGTLILQEVDLINGAGLNDLSLGVDALHFGDIQPGPAPRYLWHAGVATAGDSTGQGAAAALVSAQHLDFSFNSPVDLAEIHIWQYNQYNASGSFLPRGVNEFNLWVSSTASGEDFVQVGGTNNLAIGTLGSGPRDAVQPVQSFALSASTVLRVRLDIESAHSGLTNDYVALSEVHFGTVPEPATLWLAGVGIVGVVIAARRTRG